VSEKPGSGSTGLVLENVELVNTDKAVANPDGNALLQGGTKNIDTWVIGPVYLDGGKRGFESGSFVKSYLREGSLLNNGNYFERAKPQYEGYGVDEFVHLKDEGARGK
jgi:hypothetical protein